MFQDPSLDPALHLWREVENPDIGGYYHVESLVDYPLVPGEEGSENFRVLLEGAVGEGYPCQGDKGVLVDEGGHVTGFHPCVPDEEYSDETGPGIDLGFIG